MSTTFSWQVTTSPTTTGAKYSKCCSPCRIRPMSTLSRRSSPPLLGSSACSARRKVSGAVSARKGGWRVGAAGGGGRGGGGVGVDRVFLADGLAEQLDLARLDGGG